MKKLLFVLIVYCNSGVAQSTCNETRLPIVFVHGFLGSGDTWSTQIQRFSSNGFCEERLFVFDWNTIDRKINTDSLLDIFINMVLKRCNSSKVNLVGHSAGTGLCYNYLKDSTHAGKVDQYVNIAGYKMKAAPGHSGSIKTLNIYSDDDLVIKGAGDIPGVQNIRLNKIDHLQAASCEATFSTMYAFFCDGKQPAFLAIKPMAEPFMWVGGKAVQLGDNKPMTDSFIVYQFNPVNGKRTVIKRNLPGGSYQNWNQFLADGSWSFELTKNSYMEFEVHPKNGRHLFYYFEPPVRNNKNMYIRTLPEKGMIATMLGAIPADELQTALVIFSSNQAVINGRDSLAIDDIPLSTPVITPASKTAIAVFVFDDGDGVSSGNPLPGYKSIPFLSGADIFLKANENATMKIYYNGSTMVLPKRKSKDGIMIAVFK